MPSSSTVRTASAPSWASRTRMRPPSRPYFLAFSRRLTAARERRKGSPSTITPGEMSAEREMSRPPLSCSSQIRAIISLKSTDSRFSFWDPRSSRVISKSRLMSSDILSAWRWITEMASW